jgi:hypothetical protein
VSCYWELFGEQLENLKNRFGNVMETHMEQDGNKEKNQKKILPPSSKRKKLDTSLVHAEPFIGCMQLLFPKLFATIFATNSACKEHPTQHSGCQCQG